MKFEELIDELSLVKKTVISNKDDALNGIEFIKKVKRTANELKCLGFGERKIVIHRMTNNIDSVVTLLALILNKNVVFVENPHDPIQKVRLNIEKFCPFALISDKPSALAINSRQINEQTPLKYDLNNVALSVNIFSENKRSISDYDQRMNVADIAIFSSGSTGEPKAILHSIETLLNNAQMHIDAIGLTDSDTIGVAIPLYYSYGLVANLFAGLIAKAQISIHYQSGVIDSQWLAQNKITVTGLTPYFASRLLKPLPSLRVVTLGGDVLHNDRALQLMNDFPDCQFFSTYGLTEAGPRVATWKFERKILESNQTAPLGKPLSGVNLSLKVEETGKQSSGELIVKTPTRMIGYYFGKVKGFEMPNWDDDNVHTEDLFEIKNGELFFVGRKKNIIVQGGEKVFPVVIESALQKIKGVIDVKVGSVVDVEKGQVAKAYIVADNSVSLASINKILLGQFARSLIPAELEFVDSIARSLTGKVL